MNTNEPRLRKPLRLWPGVAAAVLLVHGRICHSDRRARLRRPRDDRGRSLRAACHPVVAVVQPGALVRTRRRDRPDDRGGRRGKACRPPVDCRRRDGQLELHPRDPDAERRARRLGGGRAAVSHPALAAPRRSSPSCSDVCRGCCVRTGGINGQREIGLPLAVDEDSRGAAARSGRRGAPRRCSGRAVKSAAAAAQAAGDRRSGDTEGTAAGDSRRTCQSRTGRSRQHR